MRYYVIGDLHGRYDLLELALAKIAEHIKTNEVPEYKIITLGDYVDRGPDSKKIIERLMKLQDYDVISLQGNHEAIMVESIVKGLDPGWWMGNGGDQTLRSYGHPFLMGRWFPGEDVYYSMVPQEHVKWMATLPKFYEAEKQLFVHAGIPQWDITLPPKKASNEEKMQWMLYHPSDHGGWKGKHVVHGHHQFADGPHVWSPGSKGGGRTNLDVWAYKTGRSVIGVFDDTQLTALEFLEVKVETNAGS